MPQQPTNQQPPQQRPERASNLVSGAPRRPAPEGGRPQQPQPQRQSRLVTALLFGGFALIAVLVFAVAFIAGSSPSSQVRERIAAEVKAKTGRDLTIGGETSFSFYPSVGLVLRNVTLSAPPGMGGDPTARIAALEVRVRALPLIKKQVEIEQLVLRDPVFNLRVDGRAAAVGNLLRVRSLHAFAMRKLARPELMHRRSFPPMPRTSLIMRQLDKRKAPSRRIYVTSPSATCASRTAPYATPTTAARARPRSSPR